jgi:F-type H+-transporting ATPase subunit b
MSGFTLAFQIVNFLVLALLLRRFLFKPVSAMIARRQDELERERDEGERARREANELRARAERALGELDQERARMLGEARKASEAERDEILAKAREEASAVALRARRSIEEESEKAVDALEGKAIDLATAIAEGLLRQVVAAPLADAFLERLCRHLDALPAERLRALCEELNGTELMVATAPAFPENATKRWSQEIGEHLGKKVAARFVHDESLVAGVELRFPHTTLSFSWRDGLRAAREELVHHERH